MSVEAGPRHWKLIAGRPSLDFVNTVGGREPGAEGTAGAVVLRERVGPR